MTTRVKIEIVGENMPVMVETRREDGKVAYSQTLTGKGAAMEEYVHSGQTLSVREMTTQEQHEAHELARRNEAIRRGNAG